MNPKRKRLSIKELIETALQDIGLKPTEYSLSKKKDGPPIVTFQGKEHRYYVNLSLKRWFWIKEPKPMENGKTTIELKLKS